MLTSLEKVADYGTGTAHWPKHHLRKSVSRVVHSRLFITSSDTPPLVVFLFLFLIYPDRISRLGYVTVPLEAELYDEIGGVLWETR